VARCRSRSDTRRDRENTTHRGASQHLLQHLGLSPRATRAVMPSSAPLQMSPPYAGRRLAALTEDRFVHATERAILTCQICCEIMAGGRDDQDRAPAMCPECQQPACTACWLRMLEDGASFCCFCRCTVEEGFLPCRALIGILDSATLRCQHAALGCRWEGAGGIEAQRKHLGRSLAEDPCSVCLPLLLWERTEECRTLRFELAEKDAAISELRELREDAERQRERLELLERISRLTSQLLAERSPAPGIHAASFGLEEEGRQQLAACSRRSTRSRSRRSLRSRGPERSPHSRRQSRSREVVAAVARR